jgi:UDP-glucose 4-epimerase
MTLENKPTARILLTGGAGYIASHTAVALVKTGYDVVLYDNLANSQSSIQGRLERITAQSIPLIEADVRDTAVLESVLCEYKIDAVIHFAGLKAVGESGAKPIDYYDNNVGGTISLLKAMNATGVKSLVFSSSATVYGEPHYLPLDETHPTSAANPYGRTKLHIEEMLADVAQSDPAWHILCLRYFNPVGAHDSGLIGEDPNGIPNNLVPYLARVATGRLPHLKIFGNDYDTKDGTGVRDYIHVMDLAEGHKAALDFLQTNPGWHAVNLGTGRGYSVLEMVRAFETASGKTIPYQIVDRRPGDVATCFAQVDKANSALNWVARRSLQQMCASAWRFNARVQTEGL